MHFIYYSTRKHSNSELNKSHFHKNHGIFFNFELAFKPYDFGNT